MAAEAGRRGEGRRRPSVGLAGGTALLLLTAVNLLNYLDRYVLSAVLPWVQADFALTDARSGVLGSMFMVMYLLASPFAGYFGDRWQRRYLVAGGVFLWSLATIASGLATGYGSLLVTRGLIGIGEAGYATVAPGMIADLYRRDRRGRMLAYFYMAIPVGSALGYLVGGLVGAEYGWRWAFVVAGAPGLVLAFAALRLAEPRRGASDEGADAGPELRPGPTFSRLLRTPGWRINTLGTTLMTFVLGGLAFWMPTYLNRVFGMSVQASGAALGGILLVSGIGGTLLGGFLGDRAYARRQGGYLTLCGKALLVCVPLLAVLPFIASLRGVLALTSVTLFLLAMTVGPINAALVGSVPATLRSSAVALNVLAVHLFGDALSPFLIGRVSDSTSLQVAVALTALPLAVGGVVLLRGGAWVDRAADGLLTYPG